MDAGQGVSVGGKRFQRRSHDGLPGMIGFFRGVGGHDLILPGGAGGPQKINGFGAITCIFWNQPEMPEKGTGAASLVHSK